MRLASLAVLAFWLGSCAFLLGFEEGHPAADSCTSDSVCAPNQMCDAERCRSIACSNPDARSCRGLQPLVCTAENIWQPNGLGCEGQCNNGDCRIPKSCALISPHCGELDRLCCKSDSVSGGSFDLYTSVGVFVRRSVSSFAMDEFEVTVGRFKRFIESYDALDAYGEEPWPAPGMGANPHVHGSGWRAEYHARHLLPKMQLDVRASVLSTCPQDLFEDEKAPMRCVDWYLAWAFCIWDGGRLPTEAEWTFAATGGDGKRLYPWSEAAFSDSITPEHAVYSEDSSNTRSQPAPVGTHHEGRGVFGHQDLAGNVSEWVADDYEPDPPKNCHQDDSSTLDTDRDCLASSQGKLRVVKGGNYAVSSDFLKNTSRGWQPPEQGSDRVGFRCVRD